MKIDEYLEKKKTLETEKSQKLKELEEAEKRAKEIKDSLKAEKKKHAQVKLHNFSLFGLRFRPWTLNDVCIIAFFLIILVVGGLFFVPGINVVNDDTSESEGFFTKLFGSIAELAVRGDVVSEDDEENGTTEVDDEEVENNIEDEESDSQDVEEESVNKISYRANAYYKDNVFNSINVTNQDYVSYNLDIFNDENFDIKCDIDHFVNDELKAPSSFGIVSDDSKSIPFRESSTDSENGLSKIRFEVKCYDEDDKSTTETLKKINLKFYFS